MGKAQNTIVETSAGKVEGLRGDDLYLFMGIPYASPPVGDKRWLPPEPVEPWTGVRQAQSWGGVAPQNPPEAEILSVLERNIEEVQNEDCLYLNVYSPGLDDAKRPVLFWIHGGGFQGGAGSRPTYEGNTLAKRGNVVLVTINYRLGSLGFLNLNEITGGKIPATGNEGLLDQVTALEWVRDNIAGFGGDPNNVTIFGESAGGMSVGALLGLPRARGLFHKAIPQSGAASTILSLEGAVKVAEEFLDILGVKSDDVDVLRSLPVEKMIPAQRDLPPRTFRSDLRITMPFQPVVDGNILPKQPFNAVQDGSADAIPVLVGSTLEEWKLFGVMDPKLAKLDEEGLVRRCKRRIPAGQVKEFIETYRSARAKRGDATTPGELFMAIETDRIFRIPAIRLAEIQCQRKNPAYNYLFTWSSPLLDGRLGACHALELGFLFGTYEEKFSGTGPAADVLARKIQDSWLAFAHTGDPSCESLGNWPIYFDKKETMMLGESCGVEEASYDEERRVWDTISNTVIGSL